MKISSKWLEKPTNLYYHSSLAVNLDFSTK